MLPEAIYDQYLLYATESNRVLEAYKTLVAQLGKEHLKLELVYLHKNIHFIFKKLVTVFTNHQLWRHVADDCANVGYQSSVGLCVDQEREFLINNREQIIHQLECIHNTTAFETDVVFLSKCFDMLQASYHKLKAKYEHGVANNFDYRIAS